MGVYDATNEEGLEAAVKVVDRHRANNANFQRGAPQPKPRRRMRDCEAHARAPAACVKRPRGPVTELDIAYNMQHPNVIELCSVEARFRPEITPRSLGRGRGRSIPFRLRARAPACAATLPASGGGGWGHAEDLPPGCGAQHATALVLPRASSCPLPPARCSFSTSTSRSSWRRQRCPVAPASEAGWRLAPPAEPTKAATALTPPRRTHV